MNRIFKILFLCLGLGIPALATAQAEKPVFDLSGLVVQENYTKQQIVDALGEPDAYQFSETEAGYGRLTEFYHYKENSITFIDGAIGCFYLADNRFSIFTAESGGLTVGDPLNRVSQLKLGPLVPLSDGRFCFEGWDDILILVTKKGRITEIIFTESI